LQNAGFWKKNPQKFAYIKKKLYFCSRFCKVRSKRCAGQSPKYENY